MNTTTSRPQSIRSTPIKQNPAQAMAQPSCAKSCSSHPNTLGKSSRPHRLGKNQFKQSHKKTVNPFKGLTAKPCLMVCKTIGLLLQCAFFWLAVCGSSVNAKGYNDNAAVYNINLPRQSVARSLTALSAQTKVMLLFSYSEVEQVNANPVAGRYTLAEALKVMLRGTGYSGGLTSKGVLMISSNSQAPDDQIKGIESMNSKKKLLASTIAFFVGSGASDLIAQNSLDANDGLMLEEVVITASRREKSLNDTAISAATAVQ